MEAGRYYVIAISSDSPSLQGYPKFVHSYLSRIVGLYKGSYIAHGKNSCMFEHSIPRGQYLMYGALTQIANNRCLKNYNFNEWVTHIYQDRFNVVKDITPLVRTAIDRFKTLKTRRHNQTHTALCALARNGIHADLSEYIIKRHLYPNAFRSK